MFDGMGCKDIAAEITCERRTMECTEVRAPIRRFIPSTPMLDVETTRWRVDRWSDVELSARNAAYLCIGLTLRINGVQQSATKIRSAVSTDQACAHITQEDVVIRLEDGAQLAIDAGSRLRLVLDSVLDVTPETRAFLRAGKRGGL